MIYSLNIQYFYQSLRLPSMVSNTQNAGFAGLCIFISTIVAHFTFPGDHNAGFMLIGLLSVVGVNAKGTIGNRMRLSLIAAFIMIVITLAAKFTEQKLIPILLGCLLVAFILAYCRKIFPYNWADISLPAGASFVMLVPHSHHWQTSLFSFYGIALGLLLCFLFVLLYMLKKTLFNQHIAIPNEKIVYYEFQNPLYLPKELLKFAIELAIVLIISNWFTESIKETYPHGYWMPLTVIVVLQVQYSLTINRVNHRVFGTLLGCILGSGLLMIDLPGWFLMFSPALCLFLFLYLAPKKYYLAVVFMTLFVLLFIAKHSPEPITVMLERLCFSALGGLISFISAWTMKILDKTNWGFKAL